MVDSSFERLLETMTKEITVEHIMTWSSSLLTFDYFGDIQKIKEIMKSKNYDIVPVSKEEKIIGYVLRADVKKGIKICSILNDIGSEERVNHDIPILRLVELLMDREFFFVYNNDELGGFVHFSDLNKQAVRVLFYLLLSEFESKLHSWIKKQYPDGSWKTILSGDSCKKIEELYEQLKKKNSEISLDECLYFADMLKIAKKTHRKFEKYSALNDFRNEIMHPTRPVVYNYSRVKKLNEKRLLLERGIERFSKV